jgi:hypothetical protein
MGVPPDGTLGGAVTQGDGCGASGGVPPVTPRVFPGVGGSGCHRHPRPPYSRHALKEVADAMIKADVPIAVERSHRVCVRSPTICTLSYTPHAVQFGEDLPRHAGAWSGGKQEGARPWWREHRQDLITGAMSPLASGLALRCPASLLIPCHTGPVYLHHTTTRKEKI